MKSSQSQPRPGRASQFGRLKLGTSLVLGGWGLGLSASAQYAISWSTIDGGGGPGTGGPMVGINYSVSGTIGQPDAGTTMTNGQYSVTGGFWAVPQAVQTIGSPTLTIAPAGAGQATIAWSPATPGFVLQETAN